MLQSSGLKGFSMFAVFFTYLLLEYGVKAAQMNLQLELTDVLKCYNGGTFQWYFSTVQSFNDIFLRLDFLMVLT